jgi:hypothetical protein
MGRFRLMYRTRIRLGFLLLSLLFTPAFGANDANPAKDESALLDSSPVREISNAAEISEKGSDIEKLEKTFKAPVAPREMIQTVRLRIAPER